MAYVIGYDVRVSWVPDGAGAMSVPSAQSKKFSQTSYVQVPGGDAPTIGNFNSALTGAAGTPAGGAALDMSTQINAALAQIQAWSTGGN